MLSFNRPKIGVTGPDTGGTASWIFTAISILLQGGIPVHITPLQMRDLDKLHGLIIGGGADVDPKTYEDESYIDQYIKHPLEVKRDPVWKRLIRFLWRLLYSLIFLIRRLTSRSKGFGMDQARDRMEFNMVDAALKKGMPVLGICRGMQLINIYFKGNLYSDIQPFYEEVVHNSSLFPIKKVFIDRDSKLFGIFQCHAIKVNALHHQAVREPGTGIKIAAWEMNGLVQAIESSQHDFVFGVQWHPEYLMEKRRERWLFKALVKKAREYKSQKQNLQK